MWSLNAVCTPMYQQSSLMTRPRGGTACFVFLFLWPADIQAKTSSSVCKLLFTKADNFKKWLFDRCNLSVSLHTDDLPARKQSPLKYDWSVEPVHSVKLGLGNRSVSSNKTFCHAYRCSYINIQLSDHRDSCSRKKIDALRKIIIDTIVGFNKVKDLRRCFSVRDLSGQLL